MACTNIEFLRLKIGDVDDTEIFTDEELQCFLDANDGNFPRAAADACQAIAAQAALLAKLEIIGNHTLDKRKIADYYLKLADQYRAVDDATPAYAIAESPVSDFTQREIIWNNGIRD